MREEPAARSLFGTKTGHSCGQKLDSDGLLLIGLDMKRGKPRRIVDGDKGFDVARAARTPQAPISRDPVPDAVKQRKLLYVCMGHVAGLVQLVSAYRHRRLQIFEPSQAHSLDG